MDLLLCDCSSRARRQQGLLNWDQDVFNTRDITVFCNFAEYVLKHGGHGRIHYSALQFISWWQLFHVQMEAIEEDADETEVFEGKQTQLF